MVSFGITGCSIVVLAFTNGIGVRRSATPLGAGLEDCPAPPAFAFKSLPAAFFPGCHPDDDELPDLGDSGSAFPGVKGLGEAEGLARSNFVCGVSTLIFSLSFVLDAGGVLGFLLPVGVEESGFFDMVTSSLSDKSQNASNQGDIK